MEERNDRFHQLRSLTDEILAQMLPMVVMSLVPEESPDSKEVAQLLEATDALSALCHDKPMEHLVPGSVAFPTRSVLLPNESN